MAEPAAIVPDDKDWTVVVEAGCAECRWTAPEPTAVTGRLLAAVPRWRNVLRRPAVAERPSAAVWSPLEYACHVRDVCRIFGERARLMLDQDDPVFANWDQDEAAVAGRYHAQDPADVAAGLAAAAQDTAQIFGRVDGSRWLRPGRRSNGSVFTVATLAQYFLHDVEHHLHDVRG